MGLIDTVRTWTGLQEERSFLPLTLDEYSMMLSTYGLRLNQTITAREEKIEGSFEGVVQGAYRENGIVFACILARQALFSEARFTYRQRRQGRPGDLFGTQDLEILERPWPSGTTRKLLSKIMAHVDLAGNAYIARRNRQLRLLRPDWVTIVRGSNSGDGSGDDIDAQLLGYLYHPGGRYEDREPVVLLPEEVAHFAPIPDPVADYMGISWVTPILREVLGDKAGTEHKIKFFENGATPNLAVSLDIDDPIKFQAFVEKFRSSHEGVANAYRTLFLGAGAKPVPIGHSFEQMAFKDVQDASETRIAAAAGVPPIIVGLSEGLDASTYSNYSTARRRFTDGTMRPLWGGVCEALANIVPAPTGAELWFDDRDILYLQEDLKDTAEIMAAHAGTIRTLVDSGFTPESVIEAVTATDFHRLEHTNLYSVQLQPPGTITEPPQETPDVGEDQGAAA